MFNGKKLPITTGGNGSRLRQFIFVHRSKKNRKKGCSRYTKSGALHVSDTEKIQKYRRLNSHQQDLFHNAEGMQDFRSSKR